MPNTRPEPAAGAGRLKAKSRPPSFRERVTAGRVYCIYLLAAFGGALGALAFAPWNLLPLAPLAPLAAFIAMRSAPTPGSAFRRLLLFGFCFNFGAIQWLRTIGNYAPIPLLAVLAIGLLALYMAMYLALAGWAVRRWAWPTGPGSQFVLFSCAWLLAEWLRTLGRLAVPLAQLGHAWATWPLGIQLAQFLGELGISAEILWLAGLIFYWGFYIASARRHKTTEAGRAASHVLPSIGRAIIPTMMFPVLGLAMLLLLTAWNVRLAAFAAKPQAQALRVALVQPDIIQELKLASYAHPSEQVKALLQEAIAVINEAILAGDPRPDWDRLMFQTAYSEADSPLYRQASEELRKQVLDEGQRLVAKTSPTLEADLAILPETAFVQWDFAINPGVLGRIGRMARRAGAPVLIGAGREVPHTDDKLEIYNSAYLVRPDGRLDPAAYDKIRLVPFGEALPYFDLIPGFQENIAGIGEFTEGRKATLFDIPVKAKSGEPAARPLRLGTLICFESTFSAAARESVRRGADVLAVITNDGWYGLSAGPAAHHNLSLLRAVETRRYVLRCANTGISSIVSPTGEIVATLPLGKAGLLRGTVVPKTDYGMTLFTLIGNAWMALPILLILLTAWRRRRAAL